MADVLNWQSLERPTEALSIISEALRQGRLVAFPTESAFVLTASGRQPAAIERLRSLVGNRSLEVILPRPAALHDWLPSLHGPGVRLAKRCWPGPLIAAATEGWSAGLVQQLSEEVRGSLIADETLYLRNPAHEAILATLQGFSEPLLGATITIGDSEAYTGQQVLDALGAQIDLLIDGTARYPQPVSIIEISANAWSLRREGILTLDDLHDQSACVVVFICTGNTCRSPMAEALCKKRLSDKLGCTIDELEERGYQIHSAGLSAGLGYPAANEAIAVAAGYGVDLSDHQSQPLTAELAIKADHLLVMTHGHERALTPHLPPESVTPRLLSPEGDDVNDPIGGSREVYEACARQMDDYVTRFVADLLR